MALMTVSGSRTPNSSLKKPPVPIPRKKQARIERKKKFLEAKRLFEEEGELFASEDYSSRAGELRQGAGEVFLENNEHCANRFEGMMSQPPLRKYNFQFGIFQSDCGFFLRQIVLNLGTARALILSSRH